MPLLRGVPTNAHSSVSRALCVRSRYTQGHSARLVNNHDRAQISPTHDFHGVWLMVTTPTVLRNPFDKLARRTFVAGAGLSALALSLEPAAAQRCPGPQHVKGPPVWLDMDQQELDDAYDQSVYAFNQRNIAERRLANSERVRAILGVPEIAAYGAAAIEKLEICKTKRASAPVLVFLHGGAWAQGRAAQNAYLAETFVKAGAHFI